jgi:hypothetical protein
VKRPGTNRHYRNVAGNAVAQAKAIMRGEDDLPISAEWDHWDRLHPALLREDRARRAAALLWGVALYLCALETQR